MAARPRKKAPNPKDLIGLTKVPSHSVVPASGLIYEAMAMWEGARKYGPFNWRAHPVLATVYLDALDRHVKLFAAGEDIDPDSGYPHLAHAKACLAILIDAQETGNLIDNRPKSAVVARLLARFNGAPKNTTQGGKRAPTSTAHGSAVRSARGKARAANRTPAKRRR